MASVGRPAWQRELLERRRARLAAEGPGPLRDGACGRRAGAAGARPAQQLLELYRRVPAVRTLRAENIVIIEAAPGSPPPVAPGPAARLRAAEVVVYEAPPDPGRVSRLLQKFDAPARPAERAPRPAPPAPRSAERAPRPALPAPRPAERSPRPAPPSPGPGARHSDFLLRTGSNTFTVHPRGLHRARPPPPGPAAPEPRAGAANGLDGSAPEPAARKPKVGSGSPPLHRTPSATPASPAPGPASATPSQRRWVSGTSSANDSFEIRPAARPDLCTGPVGDLQARAPAGLRDGSRNSFVLVPKRKAPGAAAPEAGAPGGPGRGTACPEFGGANGAGSPLGPEELGRARPATALVDQVVLRQPLPSPSPSPGAPAEPQAAQGVRGPEWSESGREPGLPVTFIDEVDSEDEAPVDAKLPSSGAVTPPQYHPHPCGAGHRDGSTFLVVPKRNPGSVQASGEPRGPEAEGEESAPGATLKPRYPTVHEIEVVGGYLSLQRSCLAKAGSSRKKMKISFNDKSLQTTFEYPSESSLAQEATDDDDEEEEEEEEQQQQEQPCLDGGVEKPFKLFLPRATFVGSLAPESPLLPDGTCLSSYTPKHSLAFSKWQEPALEPAPRQVEAPLKEVMLTPAGQDDLSDFRSEPALYF
ncbi:taperin [Sorex fumeus]|uniref:taperin n=1 Tax=Sorex fumeus TaxID=62283 RepID=UPI0024AD7852|nr:taperin [Sorex fumeus]